MSGKTEVNSISEMHDLGARIGKELAAGDLLLLSGSAVVNEAILTGES